LRTAEGGAFGTTARAETAARRAAIYARLKGRNQTIGVLRIGLPILGIAVFAVFAAQIFLANLSKQFGIGQVSLSGDTVTIDTPSYSGTMDNGTVYKVSAASARTSVTDLNVINMQDAILLLTKPDGSQMTARAAAGSFETLTQVMTVPGTAIISDSDGNAGTLDKVTVSLPGQTLVAEGPVWITMGSGMTIKAEGLDYTAKDALWKFRGRSTVTLPQTPGDDDDSQDDSQ
jgi:lipopolysaccharide export system protein LptC